MSHLAGLAQIEWDTRLAAARRFLAERTWSPEEAEARLLPWLAVALRAGAEPAEAAPQLDRLRRDPRTARCARELAAEECCPRPDMRAELARARDTAIQFAMRADQTTAQRAQSGERSTRLQYLAIFLGAPAGQPTELEQAA